MPHRFRMPHQLLGGAMSRVRKKKKKKKKKKGGGGAGGGVREGEEKKHTINKRAKVVEQKYSRNEAGDKGSGTH